MNDIYNIYDKQITNFKYRIENIGQKYPNLLQAFSMKKNDPHIERMISSFAMISASLEYEVEKKISKEIKSIFVNIFPEEFANLPPIGSVLVTPEKNKHFKIEKNMTLRAENSIFVSKNDFYINDIYIDKIDQVFYNNQLCLQVIINGNNLESISTIDFLIDSQSLNKIIKDEKEITGILKNRDSYDTNFSLKLHSLTNLKEFLFFPFQSHFLRASNFKINRNLDFLEIFIPLKSSVNLSQCSIQTNVVVIENRFTTLTVPFDLVQSAESLIPMERNCEFLRAKCLKKIDGEVIPHSTSDNSGWHIVLNDNSTSLYCDRNISEKVFLEMECYNSVVDANNIFFEDYIPGRLSWVHFPSEPFLYNYQSQISSLINLIKLDESSVKESLNAILILMNMYNKSFNLNFKDIEIIERIKPVKKANYILPKLFSMITARTSSSNYILLRHIAKEITKHIENVDCLFKTSDGNVIYEQ